MKSTLTLILIASLGDLVTWAFGQQFYFNNRVVPDIDARFVLSTDAPGTSSVGTNFQVYLFAGPQGTPLDQLQPTSPPVATMRGTAGAAAAGYANGLSPFVSGLSRPTNTTQVVSKICDVLVRVYDGPSWEAASYRFQGLYDVRVTVNGGPVNLPLGTSPLVLYPANGDQAFVAIKRFGTNLVISYNGELESASSVSGPWQLVPGAASQITLPSLNAPAQFFRVR